MKLCHFEDSGVQFLEPLSLTRPAFALRCGVTDLAEKQRRYFQMETGGVLIRPFLQEVFEDEYPHIECNDAEWLRGDDTIFVNARWLPPISENHELNKPCVATIDDDVAYAYVPAGMLAACCPNTIGDCIQRWRSSLPQVPASGAMIRYAWDLVEHNPERIVGDFARLDFSPIATLPQHVTVAGPRDQLAIADDATLEPFVAIDTSGGPVIIDREATVTSFSRLEGPCYIGRKAQIMGAKIRAGTSLGLQCRVGGEVEASIMHAHSNKYHDGFLGHAYVGEWVNLGAGTHNSDLRNDYGEVAVPVRQARVKSGLNKVGCFIGDHTKTALGTLINTGSNIGAFANLLPAGALAPKLVPSFTALWNGRVQETSNLDEVFATAAKAMSRRGRRLTEAYTTMYRKLFDETAVLRQWAIQERDKRRVSRSA